MTVSSNNKETTKPPVNSSGFKSNHNSEQRIKDVIPGRPSDHTMSQNTITKFQKHFHPHASDLITRRGCRSSNTQVPCNNRPCIPHIPTAKSPIFDAHNIAEFSISTPTTLKVSIQVQGKQTKMKEEGEEENTKDISKDAEESTHASKVEEPPKKPLKNTKSTSSPGKSSMSSLIKGTSIIPSIPSSRVGKASINRKQSLVYNKEEESTSMQNLKHIDKESSSSSHTPDAVFVALTSVKLTNIGDVMGNDTLPQIEGISSVSSVGDESISHSLDVPTLSRHTSRLYCSSNLTVPDRRDSAHLFSSMSKLHDNNSDHGNETLEPYALKRVETPFKDSDADMEAENDDVDSDVLKKHELDESNLQKFEDISHEEHIVEFIGDEPNKAHEILENSNVLKMQELDETNLKNIEGISRDASFVEFESQTVAKVLNDTSSDEIDESGNIVISHVCDPTTTPRSSHFNVDLYMANLSPIVDPAASSPGYCHWPSAAPIQVRYRGIKYGVEYGTLSAYVHPPRFPPINAELDQSHNSSHKRHQRTKHQQLSQSVTSQADNEEMGVYHIDMTPALGGLAEVDEASSLFGMGIGLGALDQKDVHDGAIINDNFSDYEDYWDEDDFDNSDYYGEGDIPDTHEFDPVLGLGAVGEAAPHAVRRQRKAIQKSFADRRRALQADERRRYRKEQQQHNAALARINRYNDDDNESAISWTDSEDEGVTNVVGEDRQNTLQERALTLATSGLPVCGGSRRRYNKLLHWTPPPDISLSDRRAGVNICSASTMISHSLGLMTSMPPEPRDILPKGRLVPGSNEILEDGKKDTAIAPSVLTELKDFSNEMLSSQQQQQQQQGNSKYNRPHMQETNNDDIILFGSSAPGDMTTEKVIDASTALQLPYFHEHTNLEGPATNTKSGTAAVSDCIPNSKEHSSIPEVITTTTAVAPTDSLHDILADRYIPYDWDDDNSIVTPPSSISDIDCNGRGHELSSDQARRDHLLRRRHKSESDLAQLIENYTPVDIEQLRSSFNTNYKEFQSNCLSSLNKKKSMLASMPSLAMSESKVKSVKESIDSRDEIIRQTRLQEIIRTHILSQEPTINEDDSTAENIESPHWQENVMTSSRRVRYDHLAADPSFDLPTSAVTEQAEDDDELDRSTGLISPILEHTPKAVEMATTNDNIGSIISLLDSSGEPEMLGKTNRRASFLFPTANDLSAFGRQDISKQESPLVESQHHGSLISLIHSSTKSFTDEDIASGESKMKRKSHRLHSKVPSKKSLKSSDGIINNETDLRRLQRGSSSTLSDKRIITENEKESENEESKRKKISLDIPPYVKKHSHASKRPSHVSSFDKSKRLETRRSKHHGKSQNSGFRLRVASRPAIMSTLRRCQSFEALDEFHCVPVLKRPTKKDNKILTVGSVDIAVLSETDAAVHKLLNAAAEEAAVEAAKLRDSFLNFKELSDCRRDITSKYRGSLSNIHDDIVAAAKEVDGDTIVNESNTITKPQTGSVGSTHFPSLHCASSIIKKNGLTRTVAEIMWTSWEKKRCRITGKTPRTINFSDLFNTVNQYDKTGSKKYITDSDINEEDRSYAVQHESLFRKLPGFLKGRQPLSRRLSSVNLEQTLVSLRVFDSGAEAAILRQMRIEDHDPSGTVKHESSISRETLELIEEQFFTEKEKSERVHLHNELVNIDNIIKEMEKNSQKPNAFDLCRRGSLRRKLGYVELALGDLNASIEAEPMLLDAYWQRHLVFIVLLDDLAALEDLVYITEHNSKHARAFRSKADIFLSMGLLRLAVVNYTKAIMLKDDDIDVIFSRGLLYEQLGEMGLAMDDFRRVTKLSPTHIDASIKHGDYCYGLGMWEAARNDYTIVLDQDSRHLTALISRSKVFVKGRHFAEALADLSTAVHVAPRCSEALYLRGLLLRKVDHKRALHDLSLSLLLDNSAANNDAYMHRGILYTKMDMLDCALADFKAVVAHNPTRVNAYINIGVLSMQQKQMRKALEYFRQAIAADPTYIRTYLCRADVYISRGTPHRALREYSRIIHMDPVNHLYYLYRGRVQLEMNDLVAAKLDFRIASSITGLGQSPSQRAVVYAFLQQYHLAIKETEQLLAERPSAELHIIAGKTRMKAQQWHQAIQEFNDALSITNSSLQRRLGSGESAAEGPRIYYNIGLCFENLKDYRKAIQQYNASVSLNSYAPAHYRRGLCKLRQGNNKGLADLNKALLLAPEMFEVYLSRAAYYEMRGNYSRAIIDCNDALLLQPTSVRTLLHRGALKCKLRQLDAAIADFTKCVSINRSLSAVFYNRATALQMSGKMHRALIDYSTVLLLDNKFDAAYRNRAILYWNMGDASSALFDVIKARNMSPGDARLYDLMGRCYHRLSMRELAIQAFTKALELNPFMIEARLGRGNVYGDAAKDHQTAKGIKGVDEPTLKVLKMKHQKASAMARRDYAYTLHLYPLCISARINLAYGLQADGKYQQAWGQFASVLGVDPKCRPALEGRAVISLVTGNYFGAYVDITSSLEVRPSAEHLTNRGVVHERMGDKMSAIRDYQTALKLDPTFALAYFNAANLYFIQRQFKQASEYLDMAVMHSDPSINPDEAGRFLLNRGNARVAIKQYNEALEDYKAAANILPHCSYVYFNRGQLYAATGDYEKAEQDLTTAIELQPGDASAYQARGYVIGKQQGRTEDALRDYGHAANIDFAVTQALHDGIDTWG